MHSDEFEISLTRELNVCKSTILRIRKSLAILEQKHKKTTEVFLDEFGSGKLAGHPEFDDDYHAWQVSYESLKRWEDLERQYREIVSKMNASTK